MGVDGGVALGGFLLDETLQLLDFEFAFVDGGLGVGEQIVDGGGQEFVQNVKFHLIICKII